MERATLSTAVTARNGVVVKVVVREALGSRFVPRTSRVSLSVEKQRVLIPKDGPEAMANDHPRSGRDTPTGYDFTKDEALKPAKAIRAQCTHCTCNMPGEVRQCSASAHPTHPGGCYLYPFRMGHGKDLSKGHPDISRRKAMRKECLRCMGGSHVAVNECTSTYCTLWPSRDGKGIEDVHGYRPYKQVSPELKKKLAEFLSKARAKKSKTPLSNNDSSPESTNAGPVRVERA